MPARRALLAGLWLGAAALGGVAQAAPAPEQLTVAWRDKPPYHYLENGIAKGFLLQRSRAIFEAAGINARFVNEPQKRIWAHLLHGASNCSIGWYRLPERESLVQFSQPIHEDPPHTILIAPGMEQRVQAHATLESLLSDTSLTLGVVEGVSYGPQLDQMIKTSQNQPMRRTVEATQMMRMLALGRASFMFADREDWEFYRLREPSIRALARYDPPNMPPGLRRHIICSLDVPPETMNKINQAISATGGMNSSVRNKTAK